VRTLLCGDDRRQVEVRESKQGMRVSVDGACFELEVREVAQGTYVVEQAERREKFHCVRDGDRIHLFWRGVVYVIEELREGARAAQRHVSGGLEAPMPGKVIKLSVTPGQAVRKGQEILVIEAMKMENALRAPRDGTIKSLAAKLGDMVAPGAVLAEIE
jgi:acetyl/propionyl-CoA carboxylase alpha subunit